MNYSELLTNVRNYSEVDSNVLSNSVINVFITNVQNKIAREVDLDEQRRYATTTCTANNAFLDVTGPEGGFRFARSLQLVGSDGTRTYLEQRDQTFMDEYSPKRSETTGTGQPKYWANWDYQTLMLAPTPDQVYTVEMAYIEEPQELDTSNASSTTWISENAPEVLLYGVLAETFSYLKNPQDMQLYEAKYSQALQALATEQMGRNRRDEYSDGVVRIPMKSQAP
jgi:hypothetical protein